MINGRPSVLYLMICGAGPADHIDRMVELAQADGWDVWCVATPSAIEHFLDLDALATLSGHPVHRRCPRPTP
jgi:hypothetical protein